AFPDGQINFVRASRLPTAAEETTAGTAGFGGLHVVRLGTEDLRLAALKTGSNAVPLTAAQLFHVYQCDAGYRKWNDSNIGGTSATNIVPIIPQSGSGTRSTFITDLQTAGGGTITLGSCVQTAEENDPSAITSGNFGTPADAIAPFSGSRLNLYDSSYFHNPATPYPGGAALAAGIKILSGAPPAGGSAYIDTRGLFVVFKQSDLSSSTIFEPGGTKNMIQTLFSGANPYFKTAPGQALVAAAGADPAYKDCGLNPTSC
ncbi:MAG: substrate-binding domain-containing protein, partial [Frankiaceae bacterium]|nr:substrate-binding domain-containing protein [Frankiaceae bacterium]